MSKIGIFTFLRLPTHKNCISLSIHWVFFDFLHQPFIVSQHTDSVHNFFRFIHGYFLKKLKALVIQLCHLHERSTLCDPMDCSLPGFSIHGILQAREWVAILSSRGSSWPRDQNWKGLSINFFLATSYILLHLSSLTKDRSVRLVVKGPSPNHWTGLYFFLILFLNCTWLIYRNMTDFCV